MNISARSWGIDLRRRLRAPGVVLGAGAALLLLLGLASGGFRGTRSLWAPLPYRDPEQLFVFAQTFLGQPFGFPLTNVRVWQREAKRSALAGFSQSGARAWVTPNFFELLGAGVLLGRTFSPADESSAEPLAVLSYPLWRSRYEADPGILGRTIAFGVERLRVIGVLPPEFHAVSRDVRIWTPLRLSSATTPRTAFVVGRIVSGASRERARQELVDIARYGRLRMPIRGARFALLPIEERWHVPLSVYGAAVFFALALGIALWQIARRRAPWRAWSFFLLKTALALGGLVLLWIEIVAAVRLRDDAFLRDLIGGALLGWMFLLCCAALLYWSLRDQSRRCPVCLRRVALPFMSGSWSSALEPATTEFLCDQGHAALRVPETQSSASQPRRWTLLDDFLRELFSAR